MIFAVESIRMITVYASTALLAMNSREALACNLEDEKFAGQLLICLRSDGPRMK